MLRGSLTVLAGLLLLLGARQQQAQARMLSEEHHTRLLSLSLSADAAAKAADAGKAGECDTEPVARAPVTFSEDMIGRAEVDYDLVSGYVPVTEQGDYLYYIYMGLRGTQGQEGKEDDAPLMFWTNGGPGCSSMEGATTENSPLRLLKVKEACTPGKSKDEQLAGNCDYTWQFSNNAYGWNNKFHVVYVDQPRKVGFSFGPTASKSSVDAANDYVTFIQGWLELFPQFKGRDVYVSGESYGGHYVPAQVGAIMDFNNDEAGEEDMINLRGAIIGNGCINDTLQGTDAYIEFMHEQNLIPEDSDPRNGAAAEILMLQTLGYTNNYYDYRLQNINCEGCYSYNYSAWGEFFTFADVKDALNTCGDSGADAFADNAGGCIAMPGFDSNDNYDYSGALGRALDADIKVVFYYGKQDTACNYVGGREVADTLPWSGQSDYASMELSTLELGGAPAGEIKSYGGLTFVQIEGSGHMAPLDQPPATAYAINSILDN